MPAPIPDRLASLVDRIGQDNVRAAVNLGHLRCLGQDPVTVAETLGARLRFVQLNAFGSSFGGAPLDAHRPYNEDAEAANALLDFLDASGFTGVVCLDSSRDGESLVGLRALVADARRRTFD
jgi:sugar phosphate isomerase/epimerase